MPVSIGCCPPGCRVTIPLCRRGVRDTPRGCVAAGLPKTEAGDVIDELSGPLDGPVVLASTGVTRPADPAQQRDREPRPSKSARIRLSRPPAVCADEVHRHCSRAGTRSRSGLLPTRSGFRPHPAGRCSVAVAHGRPCPRRTQRVSHHPAPPLPGFGESGSSPVRSRATCAPLGLVNVVGPTRTVGTVSSPLFTLRTKARACSSSQMLCHTVGTLRRSRSRRSAEQ